MPRVLGGEVGDKRASHIRWPQDAEWTWYLERCRVKKGPEEVGPGEVHVADTPYM